MPSSTKLVTLLAALSAVVVFASAGCMVVNGPDGRSGGSDSRAEHDITAEARPAAHPLAAGGQQTYETNCASCHASGMAGAPELTGITERMDRPTFVATLDEGPGAMPSWEHLSDQKKQELWTFLDSPAAKHGGAVAQTDSAGGCGGGRGGGCGGGCGCGGGGGGCGAVAQNNPAPEPTKPAQKAGGCGCGR